MNIEMIGNAEINKTETHKKLEESTAGATTKNADMRPRRIVRKLSNQF